MPLPSTVRLLFCVITLCVAPPTLAAPPTSAPVLPDPTRLAAHLEAELTEAQEAVSHHGHQLESLLASSPEQLPDTTPSTLGRKLITAVQELRSALPRFVRADERLFEELFGELAELERLGEALASERDPARQRAHLDELAARSAEMTDRLRTHLRRGVARFGERVGAPPALVVSGGVSLGSYQAGFLYYYTLFLQDRAQVMREIPPEHRASLRALGLELPENPASGFTIVTGASAGSVNALLAAYAGCLEPERVPTRSLFFQTWNTLSMETLLQEGSVAADHLFSSQPIQDAINRIKDLSQWKQCRFSLGATTTRLDPREIDLVGAVGVRSRSREPIRLARFTEKFLLSASGEPGRAPEFCPFPGCDEQPPAGATFYPRLAQPEGTPISLDSVFNMVAASGAFPTAFAPRLIPHRYLDSRTGQWVDDDETLFADGGIYNNNPLGLALQMSRWEPSSYGERHRFLYFDPEAVAWAWPPEEEQKWPGPGLLSSYEKLLKGFVGTAMNAQLMDTLEAAPEIRERMDVPVRHAPLAGEHLLAMSAFLDEDFRTFDFHRGMVDAWHFLTRESDTYALFNALTHLNPGQRPVAAAVDSPLFDCFLAFEESDAEEPGTLPECSRLQGEERENILSLMAVSRKLLREPTLSKSNKFERFTEALAERGYTFRSGVLEGQPASALRRKFRYVAGEAVTKLTSLQPSSQRLGFEVATRLALNEAIIYQPVPLYGFVGLTSSGIELAVSPMLSYGADKELRLRAGVRGAFQQSAPLLDGSVTPTIDMEGYLNGAMGLGIPAIRPIRLELGLGLLTAATYLWGPGDWASVRFAAEGALTVVAAERIEVSLRPRLYLDLGRSDSPLYLSTTPGRNNPRYLDTVGVLLGAGWRF